MSFHGAPARLALVVQYKGCHRQVAAGIRSIPDNALAIPLSTLLEHRQYRPTKIFEGRLALELI